MHQKNDKMNSKKTPGKQRGQVFKSLILITMAPFLFFMWIGSILKQRRENRRAAALLNWVNKPTESRLRTQLRNQRRFTKMGAESRKLIELQRPKWPN